MKHYNLSRFNKRGVRSLNESRRNVLAKQHVYNVIAEYFNNDEFVYRPNAFTDGLTLQEFLWKDMLTTYFYGSKKDSNIMLLAPSIMYTLLNAGWQQENADNDVLKRVSRVLNNIQDKLSTAQITELSRELRAHEDDIALEIMEEYVADNGVVKSYSSATNVSGGGGASKALEAARRAAAQAQANANNLYESIMKSVSKTVKRMLNEDIYDDMYRPKQRRTGKAATFANKLKKDAIKNVPSFANLSPTQIYVNGNSSEYPNTVSMNYYEFGACGKDAFIFTNVTDNKRYALTLQEVSNVLNILEKKHFDYILKSHDNRTDLLVIPYSVLDAYEF